MPMISRFPSAGHLLISLLLVTECNSAAADARGQQLLAMAKAASGGAAWDRLEIMHDTGTVIMATGEVSRYEHWSDGRFPVTVSDYREVRGVMVPFTQVSEGTTVKSQTVKFEAAGTVSFSLPPGHAP